MITDSKQPRSDPSTDPDPSSTAGAAELMVPLRGADLTGQAAPTPAEADSDAGGAVPRALTEATLVSRAQDGEAAAFEQLARAYEAELVRLGYRMLADLGEAQDAAQDTLLVAWRKLPTLKDPVAFHAWVYQLMTRRCLNLLRSRARSRTRAVPDADLEQLAQPAAAADTEHGPAAHAQVGAMRDSLTAALEQLPAELRACWVLHAMHDLTYSDIAYAIGVPVSTVRGRISRARVQLAKGMSAWQ